MTDIQIIDKPEAKSALRKLTELAVATVTLSLWLLLLLPVLNAGMWFIGLTSIDTEFINKGVYLVFIQLIEQMGLLILVSFITMRTWGLYNYYRYGHHERRNHKMPESIEKSSHFYCLQPQALMHLETRKEIIWPHKSDNENVSLWLKNKGMHQLKRRDSRNRPKPTIKRPNTIISISMASLISFLYIVITAGVILYAAGGFQ